MKDKEKIYYGLITTLMMFFLHGSSYTILLDETKDYSNLRDYMLLCIIIIFLIIYKKYVYKLDFMVLIWILFCFVTGLAAYRNQGSLDGFKLLLVPIIYFGIMMKEPNIIKVFTVASIFNGYYILLHSIIVNPVIGAMYSGVYYNPNTFGASMAAFFISSLAGVILFKDKIVKVFCLFSCVVSVLFELASFCRTGMLACLAVLLMAILYYFKIKKITKMRFVILMFLALFLSFMIIYKYNSIVEFILTHIYKWGNGTDISSTRIEMWISVLENLSVWGHNPSFMPHNQFIGILYYYGIISASLYLIFIIQSLYRTISQFRISENANDYVAIMFLVGYICISFFEESLGFTGREWLIMGYIGMGYSITKTNLINNKSIKFFVR